MFERLCCTKGSVAAAVTKIGLELVCRAVTGGRMLSIGTHETAKVLGFFKVGFPCYTSCTP